MTEKIAELLQNEEFVARMQNISVDEALEILKSYGVDATEEEFKKALEEIAGINENGELDEQDLESVAGGAKWYQKYVDTAAGMWNGFWGHCKSSVKDIASTLGKLVK